MKNSLMKSALIVGAGGRLPTRSALVATINIFLQGDGLCTPVDAANTPVRLHDTSLKMFQNMGGLLLILFLVLGMSACTSVGTHDRNALKAFDFGQREELRICILAEKSITEADARMLMSKVGEEFSSYGLDVTVPWVRPWVRPAFSMNGIIEDVARRPLEPGCDRMFALVGRHGGDFLYGLLGSEVLGAVETASHTRGYVVAEIASFTQLIVPPADAAIHESYHMLGCGHESSLNDCYLQISKMKQAAQANRERGNDFFPGVTVKNKVIISRNHADKFVSLAFPSTTPENVQEPRLAVSSDQSFLVTPTN
jgi:hypothetical protein